MKRLLIIAGSDSGAGAGLQADLKTAMAMGVYATTAVTAITAQNTQGVQRADLLPPDLVRAQIDSVLTDIGTDAVKTGMLGTQAIIATVAAALPPAPFVLDPVMVAKGGHALLQPDAVAALRTLLLPRATLLTPNVPEAEALTGLSIHNAETQRAAGHALRAAGARAVLIKGGHLQGDTVTDWLIDAGGETAFTGPRVPTPHTHGTGCTLATAIACGLAQALPLRDAIARARAYVQRAIETAPGLGHGHGPLNHAATGWP